MSVVGRVISAQHDAVSQGWLENFVPSFCFVIVQPAFNISEVRTDRDIHTPTSSSRQSTAKRVAKGLDCTEEHIQIFIPAQQPIHKFAAGLDDLTRKHDKEIAELLELHTKHFLFLSLVLFVPSALVRQR